MSADVIEQVFEPPFSTRTFGVGLVMPIVRQALQQHGGGIEIGSEPGPANTANHTSTETR